MAGQGRERSAVAAEFDSKNGGRRFRFQHPALLMKTHTPLVPCGRRFRQNPLSRRTFLIAGTLGFVLLHAQVRKRNFFVTRRWAEKWVVRLLAVQKKKPPSCLGGHHFLRPKLTPSRRPAHL